MDHYLTIKDPSRGLYKEKGSKFLSYLYQVESDSDAKDYIKSLKSLHPKANHICFAIRLGEKAHSQRYNDDGEPSGTAGRPILGTLVKYGVTNIVCAVVRYFGGTKLGTSGLIRAYRNATEEAVHAAEIIQVLITRKVTIKFPIHKMGRVYEIVKSRNYEIIESHFEPEVFITVHVPISDIQRVRALIISDYLGYGVNDIVESEEYEIEVEINIEDSGRS